MKLYTRQGDDGSTRLFGNARVQKDSLRVAAYGDVDELNSVIGLAISSCEYDEIKSVLTSVQNQLFDVGADLSTPADSAAADKVTRINAMHIGELESMIDASSDLLPPLRVFVLPGGTELASRLHIARTVCRRAERACVSLANVEDGISDVVIYLNRLSDLMFALARRANQLANVEDVPWQK